MEEDEKSMFCVSQIHAIQRKSSYMNIITTWKIDVVIISILYLKCSTYLRVAFIWKMDATKKFFFSFNGINYFLFIRKLTITNRIRHFSIAFTSSVFTQRQSQYLVLDLSLPDTVCVCVGGGGGGCLLHVYICETLYHFELKKISSMKIIFQLQVPLKKSPHSMDASTL